MMPVVLIIGLSVLIVLVIVDAFERLTRRDRERTEDAHRRGRD